MTKQGGCESKFAGIASWIIGGIASWARVVSLTVVLWLIAATIVPSFLGWFLTPIFMVLFRSAIAPEIACFIGFSAILGRF